MRNWTAFCSLIRAMLQSKDLIIYKLVLRECYFYIVRIRTTRAYKIHSKIPEAVLNFISLFLYLPTVVVRGYVNNSLWALSNVTVDNVFLRQIPATSF